MPRKRKNPARRSALDNIIEEVLSPFYEALDDAVDILEDVLADEVIQLHQAQSQANQGQHPGIGARTKGGQKKRPGERPQSRHAQPQTQATQRTITLYDILQVTPNASPEIIQAAYRAFAKQYHPDVNNSRGSTDDMKAINAAWEVLRDPAKRKDYDRSIGVR